MPEVKVDTVPVFDITKLKVSLDGEEVTGHPYDKKITIRRIGPGNTDARLFILGTSPWVLALRENLMYPTDLDVDYDGELGVNLNFRGKVIISGYEVTYTNEVPVYEFFLTNQE